ncbi:hypothetical protein BBJ28_00006703 [Nothophytophthora sp. Chile5]|nr:hypothetical protein BBJ28_00006703 [Nothophytophthora sp. Chile5]
MRRHFASFIVMALSRNFRTTYYKTLGVPVVQHIVDVEASFAALLSERVVNVPQLVKLALELGITPNYRARAWLLLAGVLPPYPALWDFALRERCAMFHDVVGAAQVLQTKDVGNSDSDSEEDADEADVAGGVYYDFMELLADDDDHGDHGDAMTGGGGSEDPASHEALRRLVHLHRTYWQEIAAPDTPLLRGMEDPRFLRGVARVVCAVLPHESERFWCFTRVLELFHDGLELVDPVVSLRALYNTQVADFELLFLRTLDAKRRRLTADAPLSSLQILKTGMHEEDYGRRR